ncbi:MAG: hypothetical protein JO132_03025 [Streptosporangiaceae bacterium]|nr:hypothetical protein [Streptosporangiaceae bacterium]
MKSLGLRTAGAQPLLRDKISIGIASDATPAQLADNLLRGCLHLLFCRVPAIAVGDGCRSYLKPVLHVFNMNGTPLGYSKAANFGECSGSWMTRSRPSPRGICVSAKTNISMLVRRSGQPSLAVT